MSVFNASLRAALPALLSFLSLAAALPLQAQPTVVVTGTREALAPERLVGDVIVISGERLRLSAADSVEDLLRREAGLQLSRSGGPGANAGLFIRGSGSGNTLVLIDGVRIGAATVGLPELEALSLASIERIEVLRGPGSSLYGADAAGGVVQIFTRRGSGSPSLSGNLAAGGLGSREGSLAGQGRFGAFDLAASGSLERSDGVSALRPGDLFGNHNPDRDGYARRGAQAQVGYTLVAGQRVALRTFGSKLKSRYDGSDFLPPDFAQDASGDFRNEGTLRGVSLSHDGRWSDAWSSLVQLSDQHSDLISGAAAPERYRTDRRAAELQLTWHAAPGQALTAALSHLRERARTASYDQTRDNDALALAYAGSYGALSVQAEWRHDDNSVYGTVDTGRVGAAYAVGGGVRLRSLLGTTFRAPSFNDLYFPGYGVATIGPERGRSVEFGLDWRGTSSHAALTVYRNRVQDLIEYAFDRRFCPPGSEYDFGCARNIGRARLQGATLAGSTQLGPWRLRGTLDFLDATDSSSGTRLVRRAAHQQTLAAHYRQGRWSAGADLLRVGARPEGGKILAAYTTVDLTAAVELAPGWQVEARLLNAGDRDFEPARDYQSPGRQGWLGVRFQGLGL